MSKPENSFIAGVHKYLPVDLHREKMNNPYRGGTADVWYSGRLDLWIEFKYLARIPTNAVIKPDVSELQAEWLRNRHHEGRQVFVIVGCKEGGVWLDPLEWERPMPPAEFRARLQTRLQLAERIASTAQGHPIELPIQRGPRGQRPTQTHGDEHRDLLSRRKIRQRAPPVRPVKTGRSHQGETPWQPIRRASTTP